MKKKKVNPRNRPISTKTLDVNAILTEITKDGVFHGWLLMLSSLGHYFDTTTDELLSIWKAANDYSSTFTQNGRSTDKNLAYVERRTGMTMPYPHLSASGIQTEGQLNSFKRKLQKNSLYAAFSLISGPILMKELVSEDKLKESISRAYELSDDIIDKKITYHDLQWFLVTEYGLYLHNDGGYTALETCEKTFDIREKVS